VSNLELKVACPVKEKQCEHIDTLHEQNIELARLAELVSTDPLTGLYNFRHFSLSLDQEIERTIRSGQPTSMAMIDIDFFKKVNDTWGHEVGNLALKQMSDILSQSLRKIDIACRYGGEEFVIILPGTRTLEAVQIAERIRKSIASTPLVFPDGEFNFTISIGVSTYEAKNAVSADVFKAEVDQFLYQAKETGRNKTCYKDLSGSGADSEVSQDEKNLLLS